MFSIQSALNHAITKFKAVQINSAVLDARILLSFILRQPTSRLLANQDYILNQTEEEGFLNIVNRRILLEPIAYIIKEKEFYSNNFLINKDVLIPRADTELLVDIVIEKYKNNKNQPLKFLELGTGSGCIIISMLLEFLNSHGIATDISLPALAIAEQNMNLHNVADRLTLLQSDWFINLPKQKFDLIVSNPPYIAENEKEFMSSETLLYEPKQALFADDSGLYHYKQIALNSSQYLNTNGKILLEIGFKQLDQVVELFLAKGYSIEGIYKDLNNIYRAVCFKKNYLNFIKSHIHN